MNTHRATITEAQHFNVVARHMNARTGRSGVYAKPGETQAKAMKRILAASRRVSADRSPSFPAFRPGMSTADYVAQYHSMNSGRCLKTEGFFGDLNTEPAALYEGGSFDFAPIMEEIPDEAAETFDFAGSYSEHVGMSNAIGSAPMSLQRWIKVNSPAEVCEPIEPAEVCEAAPSEPDAPRDVESLRAELRDVESQILAAAPAKYTNGRFGSDIEAASRSRAVPRELKAARTALREAIRAASAQPAAVPAPTEQPAELVGPMPESAEAYFARMAAKTDARRALAASLAASAETVQLFHKSGDGRFAIAGPDMSNAGSYRVSWFDSAGPFGHMEFRTLADAIDQALTLNYKPAEHAGDDAPSGKQDHPRADAHPVAAADARPADAVSAAGRPGPAAVFMGGGDSWAAQAPRVGYRCVSPAERVAGQTPIPLSRLANLTVAPPASAVMLRPANEPIVETTAGRNVCSPGSVRSLKRTERQSPAAADTNLRQPLSLGLLKVHPAEAGRVISPKTIHVLAVRLHRDIAQIRNAVVGLNAIHVVDGAAWRHTGAPHPSEPMQVVIDAIEANIQVSMNPIHGASPRAGPRRPAPSIPKEFASLCVV